MTGHVILQATDAGRGGVRCVYVHVSTSKYNTNVYLVHGILVLATQVCVQQAVYLDQDIFAYLVYIARYSTRG